MVEWGAVCNDTTTQDWCLHLEASSGRSPEVNKCNYIMVVAFSKWSLEGPKPRQRGHTSELSDIGKQASFLFWETFRWF
jgi:hypothetical protein